MHGVVLVMFRIRWYIYNALIWKLIKQFQFPIYNGIGNLFEC